jgi:hypothetical protein
LTDPNPPNLGVCVHRLTEAGKGSVKIWLYNITVYICGTVEIEFNLSTNEKIFRIFAVVTIENYLQIA